MKKVVYIIPGFKHSPDRKIYKEIASLFQKKDFETVLVRIDWKYKTINDWVSQFLKDYYKEGNSEKYLFGFSYGAVISFLTSTQKNIHTQILCSLSPYFKEDISSIPEKWKRQVGKTRIEDFEKLEMLKFTPLVKAETYILYGTKEGKFIETRAKDAYKKLKSKKHLILIKGAKHDIADERYLGEIRKVVNRL